MSQTKTTQTKSRIGSVALLFMIGVIITHGFATTPTPKQNAMAGEITKQAVAEFKKDEVKANAEQADPVVLDDKTELEPVKAVEAVAEVKAEPTPPPVSSIPSRNFKLNNGKLITGQAILDMVKANPNGLKLWQAFNAKFGLEVADTAGVSLYYENGTMKADSIGVCTAKYMIGGDYRNCNYADMNSAGMDVGLKQINTFYQAKRITKLGGEACSFGDSRDRADPCNQKKIAWLSSVENNIKIAIDIYQEQGSFCAWYGAIRSGVVKC